MREPQESFYRASQDFSIKAILRTAWQGVKGYKATFWGGAFILFMIDILLFLAFWTLSLLITSFLPVTKDTLSSIDSVIQVFLMLPLYVGLMLQGIKRAAGIPVRAKEVLNYYDYFFALAGVYFVQLLILMLVGGAIGGMSIFGALYPHAWIAKLVGGLGALFFFLLAIYLFVGYLFALPIKVDKKLGIWQSLALSRKGVSRHWFKVFFLVVILACLALLGAVPLLIGLIWILPLSNVACGLVYLQLFGYNNDRE